MPLPTFSSILLGLALLYFAKLQEWIHWLKSKEFYGPISSISMFGQTIVILNDHQVAFDLMEKRSAIYSSRPRMVFAGEMVGWEDALTMQGYSDRFRSYRKAMHRALGTKALMSRFNPLQEVEVRRFLLRIAYGYNIEPKGRDLLVDLANESMNIFSVAGIPGTWLVDTIPLLKYLPTWFPGTRFKRTGYAWRKTLLTTIEKPYQLVKQKMRRGSYPPSYLASLLEQNDGKLNAEEEFVSKWTAGILYLGGADTRKAQEEIDRVLGPNKLPTFDDRHKLPYIDAMVKETLRWHPIGPMGRYLIPKGALILPNIWAFTHDPNVYREPGTFRPERFLDENPELEALIRSVELEHPWEESHAKELEKVEC
ncbi:cytochrome P450 [Aspergillus pseudocaelatus]|uniref:Cytochrome P450 n=1 Tax=Aspergillus pseudocaelatus TaxID=1825620 RepID=A0ABQ6WW60_9EURO|nr:cytochrome P450 [Aspergillus pseudocaelatus]